MKAAIYCRVSTEDQSREGTSLQTQLEACLKYCQDKGYDVAHRFSEAYSGLTLDRPKLTELRDLVRTGGIDIIAVYCLDRLSRDPYHGVILTQELEKHGVTLEAVTETVETSELGRLISYIRGFASKLEAEKIRERTMRGKLAHLKNGRLPQGTGIGIYGYAWDKATGRRVIIDQETETVRRIFSMAITGTSTNLIAISLNKAGVTTKSGSLWHPLTVRRILNNCTYAGKTYFGQTKRVSKSKVVAQPKETWFLLPDVTPPIITQEIFDQAQATIGNAKHVRPLKANAAYLLTGFVRCSKCGSTIGGTTLQGKYRYYQCRGARPTATRGPICDAGYIKADEVERFVWERLVTRWSSPLTLLSQFTNMNYDSSRSILPMLDRQVKQLRNKLKTYPAKEKNLYALLSHDTVTKDYVLEELATLRRRQEEDEAQLRQLQESRKSSAQRLQIPQKLTEVADALRSSLSGSMSLEEKRTILEVVQAKVVALPGSYQFTCFIDAQLTSDVDAAIEAAFQGKVEEFETLHPDLTFGDLIDHAKRVPEDTVLGRITNQVKQKDLVTTERTSA
ncbi:MAG: recombinase family protein [Dehalococcoidia bacterium]|nr:recombinase family protein [Dehalococcoidia bacterium]